MKIKKSNLLFIIIMLFFSIYTFRNYIVAFYYTQFNENKEIEILEIDLNQQKTYQDILKIEKFKNRPSFIYFNTRFSFERLEKDSPILRNIYNQYGEKLNLIFIANGLDDEPEEEKKWIVKINKFELKGTHISLPDNYKDFDTYFKETNNSNGLMTTHIPHYLLANKNGIITDTIFKGKIDMNKIKILTE